MIDPASLDWSKGHGLLPVIVQDMEGVVRMLGYMDRAALEATIQHGVVTFFSRSKQRLWVKGETSGNRLSVESIGTDCDRDAILVRARPAGPTCHTGAASCFGAEPPFFPHGLQRVVDERASANPDNSYVARLMQQGIGRLAQKVGEEGVEVALAAVGEDRDALLGEVADLVFHLTLLLDAVGSDWGAVEDLLVRRHAERMSTASS